jgi:recombination protein RecA
VNAIITVQEEQMNKKIAQIKAKMDKKFGFNALRAASELDEVTFRISTGSISLDIALGGGIAGGRVTQLCGDFSACKSVIGYFVTANGQKMGKRKVLWERYSTKENKRYRWEICDLDEEGAEPLTCALIQYEAHSYANDWAEKIGINVEDLLFVTPESMEEGFDIAVELQREHGVDIILIDSIAAAKPMKVLETESSDTYQMGIKPIKYDDFLGRVALGNNKRDREGDIPTTVVVINQLREKIGVMHGDPSYASGGKGKDYYYSIDVWFRKAEHISVGSGENKRIVGRVIKFKSHKNKTYRPFQSGSFDFYFDENDVCEVAHIDNIKELIIEAVVYDIITRKGAWFYYGDISLGQGEVKMVEYLRNDKKLFEEIKAKVMAVALSTVDRPEFFDTDSKPEEVAGIDTIDSVEDKPKKKGGKFKKKGGK